jgi:hypothetical protein
MMRSIVLSLTPYIIRKINHFKENQPKGTYRTHMGDGLETSIKETSCDPKAYIEFTIKLDIS